MEIKTNEKNEIIILEGNKPPKFRNWEILLYEDSYIYDFKEVMRILKSHKKYAYIKHQPDNDEKKEHYHFILKLDNATKKSTLSNKLGVPENYIDEIKSLRMMNRYLIHIDDEDKIQYEIADVTISKPYQREYLKCFDDLLSEEEILEQIYEFIDTFKNLDYFKSSRELVQFVNANCYDTIYKRYRPELTEYLKSVCI